MISRILGAFLFFSLLIHGLLAYNVGVGRSDMTGPSVEVAFMGYANPEQRGQGIHLRQYARAYIIDDGVKRLVFVNTDAGMMGIGVRTKVLEALAKKYGDRYNEQNVMMSGTHTHGTPGGFLMHIAFDLNTFGFVKETFNAYVSGITRSIMRAHENLQEGKVLLGRGQVLNANINRSPSAYLNNPPAERALYEGNTDKSFVQLKFQNASGNPMGVLTWYAVHGTSMNNTNKLVSSDNVGLASLMFEQRVNKNDLPGRGPFVAAFGSTNLGDVSPNIMGPRCLPSGAPCDILTSSCSNSKDKCIAVGPGKDMEESTLIIATRILEEAMKTWQSQDAEEITGPVKVVHQFVDMPAQQVNYTDTWTGKNISAHGCSSAMGYSFAAGTTDGPGMFSFRQGTKTSNPLWNILTDILAKPSAEMTACQAPKPILLATGEMNFPFEWQAKIVSTQLAKLGPLAIACVPGEFTTMSGRRMRQALGKAFGVDPSYVVIAGLCNTYADYITTPEEYQIQRYEGASTIHGPYTLPIYLNHYTKLAEYILNEETPSRGPLPNVNFNSLVSFLPGVVFDYPGWEKDFGYVTLQPKQRIHPNETVYAKFVAGNPRNNLLQENTFLSVDMKLPSGKWKTVATDSNWETKFIWRRLSSVLGTSEAEIRWTVPPHAEEGVYRIRHMGSYKYLTGKIVSYSGTSGHFQVVHS